MADEQTTQQGAGTASGDGSQAGAGASGTQTPAGTSAGVAPATPGAQSGATGYTYKEDRTDWIPRHRFNEVSTQAQRAKQLEADIVERDRKIAALAGTQTPDPDSKKAEAIREAFFNLPGMGIMRKFSALTDEQVDRLLAVPDHAEAATQAELRQWQRHGNEQVAYIGDKIAEAMNMDELTPRQTTAMRTQFSAWIKSRATAEIETEGQSKTISRYEDGDAKLLDEFVKEYTDDFIAPARRTAAAHTSTRTRAVPSSQGRSQVTQTARPASFKSLDDRLDFAVTRAKEMGVNFRQ